MREPQEPAPAESREDELTRKVARLVEGPLVGLMVLILGYYGGQQYGNSRYISHPLWQSAILWPTVAAGFVILIIDRAGNKRPPRAERQARRRAIRAMPRAERRARRLELAQPARRVSRAIARRIIARQERNRASLPPDPGVPPGM